MRQLLLLVVLTFSMAGLQAQNFTGIPPSIKYRSLEGKHSRIIYPEGFENKAARIANLVDYINKNNKTSVGDKSRFLNIVLENTLAYSNGSVSIAPFKSQFITTTPSNFKDLGGSDWLDGLTIHEYRHALQLYNAKRGLVNFAYLLRGEQAWLYTLIANTPTWYFEGDAVLAETIFSKGGRGRLPNFSVEQRANLLNGKRWSYMKARNGSLKDIIPDHYRLGFSICNHVRNNYGTEIWKDILADGAGYKFPFIYSFTSGMKRKTGKGSAKMYKEVYDALEDKWTNEINSRALTPTQAVTTIKPSTPTFYNNVKVLADGSLITTKHSYNSTKALYRIKDGKESKITPLGFSTETYFTLNNNRVAWSEYSQEPRFSHRSYSNIMSYDLNTGKKKQVTSKGKYYSPEFNTKGDKIVALKLEESMDNSIVILDLKGNELEKIQFNNISAHTFPKWTNDNKSIVYLVKDYNKIAIVKYDLDTQTHTPLTKWSGHMIDAPSINGDYVYFTASYDGIDNIYAVNLNGDQEVKQITSVPVGAYEPFVSEDTLYMSEINNRGAYIAKMSIDPNISNLPTIDIIEPVDMEIFDIKTTPEESSITSNDFSKNDYKTKKYNTIFNGIRLHTWGINSVGNGEASGFLQFNNYMDNLASRVNAKYNFNEKAFRYNASATIAKYFVETTIDGGIANRSVPRYSLTKPDSLESVTYRDNHIGISGNIPLIWKKGNYTTSLVTTAGIKGHSISNIEGQDLPRLKDPFLTTENNITLQNIRRAATQNVRPRFGQSLSVGYNALLKDGGTNALQANAAIYLPGLSKNHSTLFSFGYKQENNQNEYQFNDTFTYSRGYDLAANDEVLKASVDYAFPLFYPDFGFANIAYFKRVSANLFGDYSKLKIDDRTFYQNAVGADLIFDTTLMNVLDIKVGVRGSYLLNKSIDDNNIKIGLIISSEL